MKPYVIKLLVLLLPSLMFSFAHAAGGPVAKLDDIAGRVEYAKGAAAWKQATRSKYLFAGYSVRTGADGSARLLNQTTGEVQSMGANTEVKVTEGGFQVTRGALSKPEESGSGFWQALVNKFSKAQRYTTVRRTVIEPCKVDTIKYVALSAQYPDLVWRNAGPDCSYRLQVAGKVIEVPVSATAEMIRIQLTNVAPGEHPFTVQVVQGKEVVYSQSSPSTLKWLSDAEQRALTAEEDALKAQKGFDDVMHASFLEEKGMLVPAMDYYRSYLHANPDENDMRPLLIKTYVDLRLDDLRQKEAVAYNANAAQES